MKKNTYWVGMTIGAMLCLGCDRNAPDVVPEGASTVEQPENGVKGATDGRIDELRNDRTKPNDVPQRHLEAEADIESAEGTKIDGEAHFTEDGQGVKIVVNVKNAPVGEKGIHIHEKGDCSDIRAKSMGGHFSPQGDKHGYPDAPQDQIHLGDLGNIEIREDGTGKKEITVPKANLEEGDPMSFLGKALVIHQAKDKGASEQPSGGSGTPIACGVIEKS